MDILISLTLNYEAQIEITRKIIHELASQLFSWMLIPVTFFSLCFYIIAIAGFFMKTENKFKRVRLGKDMVKRLPKVTIQIPTRNEPVALRCAKACLKMDYPKEKVEIIIGDDSSDKRVSKMIDEFAARYENVKVTRRGNNRGYKPGNLNHMLKYSSGEIIFIFDSDFVPPRNFLKEAVKPFLLDKKVACVQGKWGYMNINKNRISKLSSFLLMFYHNLLAKINERFNVSLLFGSAEGVRKDVLVKLGGWKEWAMTEDVEFSLRVMKSGYKITYLDYIEAKGEVPFTLRDIANQQKRWAFGNTKAFLQHMRYILFNRVHNPLQKFLISFTLLGYTSSPFLLALLFLGFTMWFTGEPGRIDLVKFGYVTLKVVTMSSGFFFAGILSLLKEKKINIAPVVLITSFLEGILVTISVFDGLLKAFIRERMVWYRVEKEGNVAGVDALV